MTEKKEADVAPEHEKRVAEATAETTLAVKSNEKLHADAQKLGAAEKPYVQPPPHTPDVVPSDRTAASGATVVVEWVGFDPEHPTSVDQEKAGMGPLEVKGGKKGATAQPPGRGTGAHTKPTGTKEDGTPLLQVGVLTTTAKGSGGSVVLTGGATSGAGSAGVVYSDLPAAGPSALPTYSDRIVTDADMVHPAGGIVGSGASNLPRATAPHPGVVLVGTNRPVLPEKVESDRRLEPGEESAPIVTPEMSNRDRPHGGGGEALGMGPTTYRGYGEAADEPTSTNEGKKVRKARTESSAAAAAASKESGQKAVDAPETKVQEEPVKIETKDVKSNPSTEQKDVPVETGTDEK